MQAAAPPPRVPRQTGVHRAQRGPPPRPPSSLPAAPAAPRRPGRRAHHVPARAAQPPHPGRFPSSPAAPRRRWRGAQPAAHLRAGSRGGSDGDSAAADETLLLSGRRSRHFLAERAARPGL